MQLSILIAGFITTAPSLVGWLVAVILAAIIVSHGGHAPGKLMLSGFSIMLFRAIMAIPASAAGFYLMQRGWGAAATGSAITVINVLLGFISLAGIICIIIGFWLGFRTQRAQQV